MFARLRLEQAVTPRKSDSSSRFQSLKRRLVDEDDEDAGMHPPELKRKKKEYYSIAPLFDKYKGRHNGEEDQPSNHQFGRRRQLSPSPDPESPLVKELDDRYTHLRTTLHSAALSSLSSAEASLVASSESRIRDNRQNLASMEAQLKSLTAPLQGLTVDYMATGEDGLPRTAAVKIRDAVAAYEENLADASTELAGLWEEWEKTQAEIAELVEEIRGSRRVGDGAAIEVSPAPSASHSEAVAGFRDELEKASKDVVKEMATYEEKFLKEIEKEAGNILHSFLNR